MNREELISRIDEIIRNTENTNYGSINSEFKMIILVQEFLLKNNNSSESKENLVEILQLELGKVEESEAKVQVLGEIYMNVIGAHKNTSMLDDNGEDYIKSLFRYLDLLIKGDRLFKECNT